MPPLSVLIKPASGKCNMACKYCFYADEMNRREVDNYGNMSEDVMEQVIAKSLAFADGSCTFGFQGGEPTLIGLAFYERFVERVATLNTKNVAVSYVLQTNGYLLNDQWAQFFHQHNFLVGLSLDGDKDVHDFHRVDLQDKGTFKRVMESAKLLEKHQVTFDILTVVTAKTARHAGRIFNFFVKNNLLYQQYIPCLDPLEEPRGGHSYSLTPELYAKFLIDLFDHWYAHRKAGKFVYIRYFENLAGMLLGRPPESCGLSGHCSIQTVVEADGSVYPCDFYMLDQYKLGNFMTDTMEQLDAKRLEIGFLKQSHRGTEECQKCQYFALCHGGCRRDRQGIALDEIGHNYYCTAFQQFFHHAIPKLYTLLPPRA